MKPPGPPIPIAFVAVIHGSEALWGLRNGAHAAGIWGWPGGKADRPGTMAENAAAELHEETGLRVAPHHLNVFDIQNEWIDLDNGQSYPETLFWVDITRYEKESIRLMEPDKHAEWRWFPIKSPPPNSFAAERRALRHLFVP